MKAIYEDLYKTTDYGLAARGHCPGVRYYPHYRHFLYGNIIDLGCGRGDTVKFLIRKGHKAEGIDYIDLENGMLKGDITEDLDLTKYQTALCCDVLEHIEIDKVEDVIKNFAKCERVIATIHTDEAFNNKHNVDLHLTKQPIDWWETKFLPFFRIDKRVALQPKRWLIIGTRK